MTILAITNEQHGQDPTKLNFLKEKAEIKRQKVEQNHPYPEKGRAKPYTSEIFCARDKSA